ncbi:MAG: VIT domain-containing protein [Planctomycetota bacterium]|jgi:Ca-activated chloride channel family protein
MQSFAVRRRAAAVAAALLPFTFASSARGDGEPGRAELKVVGAGDGIEACPLEGTDVEADVTGLFARVRVRQRFRNPLPEKIEAVYCFPLPDGAAVDGFSMKVGGRVVRGIVRERAEARAIYSAAKRRGNVTSLLDQERPNVFTQSVANIGPGERVEIEISYVETVRFEAGAYEFVFPTVVGPRYMPGSPVSRAADVPKELGGKVAELAGAARLSTLPDASGRGWSPDTARVPDASRVSPPVAAAGLRAGHDLSLTIRIDAGLPVLAVRSDLHEVDVRRAGFGRAVVTLAPGRALPDRDFVLRWEGSGGLEEAFLVHDEGRSGGRGRFFSLVLAPPRRVAPERVVPKEMVFVIDRSGSMTGFPLETAKEAMRLCIERMGPRDTFNVISFSGRTGRCFARPVPGSPSARADAEAFLDDLTGSGGTGMMPAIREALGGERDPDRVRIVCFMTDGYVGNDFEIIEEVRRTSGRARVFPFGIGRSVNRFLLDRLAHAGRGEVEYVTLRGGAPGAAERFQERIAAPVLANIEVDWGTLEVADVCPAAPRDLFADRPVVVHGRLLGPPDGELVIRGRTGSGPYERRIRVTPPDPGSRREALASLWARAKVREIMMADMARLGLREPDAAARAAIVKLGADFGIMTQFTSFVAVETRVDTGPAPAKTMPVPVEMPSGVSREANFGRRARGTTRATRPRAGVPKPPAAVRPERPAAAPKTPPAPSSPDRKAEASPKRSSPAPTPEAPSSTPDFLKELKPRAPTSGRVLKKGIPPQLRERFERERDDGPDTVERPVVCHEEAEVRDHMETENNADANTARGQEDRISDIPQGGTGIIGNLGVGGGGAGAYGFRGGGGRKRAALRGGGSRESENAVDRALEWLWQHQEPDGGWSSDRDASGRDRAFVTGLATLAFLGAGHTQKTGRHRATVARAVAWLVKRQGDDGMISSGNRAPDSVGHAVCGLALAEAFGMARVASTGRAAQAAVDCSVDVLQAEYSGWGPAPGRAPETVATAWFVAQLKSAKVAGLRVDGRAFQGAIAFLDSVTKMKERHGAGRAGRRPGLDADATSTAASLVARQFMGWKRTDPVCIGAANAMMEELPKWSAGGDGVDLVRWYFGTMGTFQMGGDWWKQWNAALRDMLVERQVRGAPAVDGSWEPLGEGARRLGRAGATAACALSLEVYYRYLPIYKK